MEEGPGAEEGRGKDRKKKKRKQKKVGGEVSLL